MANKFTETFQTDLDVPCGEENGNFRVNFKNGDDRTQINTQNYSKFEENMFRSSKPDVPE